jgi:DNA-directed RNA polymerase subunit L
MNLKVLKKENNFLEFKIEGERHSLPNLLRKRLAEEKGVEFVSYKLEHPADSSAVFAIRTKEKNPKKLLLEACKKIDSEIEEFEKALKKVLK